MPEPTTQPEPNATIRPFQIDAPLVAKILELIDHGLVKGVGRPQPGRMCVEAAICFALGEPHGDEPSCVAPAVRRFKIRLNDAAWSSDLARAKGLRRVAIAQLGSRGIDENQFRAIVVEQTIRRIVPIALRTAAERVRAHREALLAAALQCEQQGTQVAVEHARNIARAAAYAAYAADAADAADAAAYAADAAADAAAAAADAAAAARASKRDEVLSIAAEIAVEALRECGSPGVAFMPDIQVSSVDA